MNEENNWYQKPEYSGVRQFLILLGLFCAGFLLTGIISAVIIIMHYGLENMKAFDTKNLPLGLLDYLMLVQDVCLFGIPAFIFSKIVSNRNDYFFVKNKSPLLLWALIIVIALAALPVSDLLAQLTEKISLPKDWINYFKQMENNYDEDALAILNFKSVGAVILSIVMIALLPAIFEELFFRGALQQAMTKWTNNSIWGIVITSIIFSAVHLSYYGFLPRFALGMVLGLVYYHGKNIWLNMLVHFINNASVVVALYFTYGSKPLTANMLNDDTTTTPLYIQLIGMAVLLFALNLFIKKSKERITLNS